MQPGNRHLVTGALNYSLSAWEHRIFQVFFFFLGFIYCWLCWVFVALGGLPLVVVNGASLHGSVRFLVMVTSLAEHRL